MNAPSSTLLLVGVLLGTLAAAEEPPGHLEIETDPYLAPPPAPAVRTPPRVWVRGGHTSVQVNVDALGSNIANDAGNEPSIAVDPTNPLRMAIGWRQFDNVASNFRQAGWGYTTNGGSSWIFPGKIDAGNFRSDPVLAADSQGNFYYYSLASPLDFTCHTFKSANGGASWGPAVFSYGGDKAWLAIDQSGGLGDGHVYGTWNPSFSPCCFPAQFNRSSDGAESFEAPVEITNRPIWGTIAVGPEGEVYVVGRVSTGSTFQVTKSTTIHVAANPLTFDATVAVALGGTQRSSTGPNPGGLLGQLWIAVDPSPARLGWVYVLASLDPPGGDPMDVHFVRSTDGGATWSAPKRVNDDASTSAWQWFGTMSVAPDGRIDAVWNDTRANPGTFLSELTYSFSTDGGTTWSASQPVSPAFDPHVGWPAQNKIGDYYHMVSDPSAAHLAYSATFNGEQDVYYLRLQPGLLFADGFESGDVSAWSAAVP